MSFTNISEEIRDLTAYYITVKFIRIKADTTKLGGYWAGLIESPLLTFCGHFVDILRTFENIWEHLGTFGDI